MIIRQNNPKLLTYKSFSSNIMLIPNLGGIDMNKANLVTTIAEKSGFNKKDSEAALNAFVASVEEGLAKGEKVVLVGFGTFEVRKRAARKGINPQTKKEISIPASSAPVFKAGKTLKEKVQ